MCVVLTTWNHSWVFNITDTRQAQIIMLCKPYIYPAGASSIKSKEERVRGVQNKPHHVTEGIPQKGKVEE